MTSTTSPTVRSSIHAGHDHPATKAARAACRRGIKTKPARPLIILPRLSHTVKLAAVGTKTGYRFTTQGPDRKLTSPTYVTSVQGPCGDWFEARSFLDAPVD